MKPELGNQRRSKLKIETYLMSGLCTKRPIYSFVGNILMLVFRGLWYYLAKEMHSVDQS